MHSCALLEMQQLLRKLQALKLYAVQVPGQFRPKRVPIQLRWLSKYILCGYLGA